jgi:phosphate starvation-inducible PhoH-like protein
MAISTDHKEKVKSIGVSTDDADDSVSLTFEDQDTFQCVRGPNDTHLRLIQRKLGVTIAVRGNTCQLRGDEFAVDLARDVLDQLARVARKGHPVYPPDVSRAIDILSANSGVQLESIWLDTVLISASKNRIAPKNLGQKMYIEAIRKYDLVFGVGPAGTGKTYLAMAMAVAALTNEQVKRIVLARPAVEAGEKLGFLPGDLAEKVNPYLRPLYDALNDMVGFERAHQWMDKGVMEVAPLAFMRGRTLNDSFVILDEAQNTTIEQMKMFLTRLGFNSRAVVTGDITQTDLAPGRQSGLKHALSILKGVDGIELCHFTEKDVVRHPLVQRIIQAYDGPSERTEREVDAESDDGDERPTDA